MRICFDIDGVLLPDVKGEGGPDAYYKRTPFPEAVFALQRLSREGHYIILHTSRGMRTCGDDAYLAQDLHHHRILKWLEEHKIPFDELHCGKPRADLYVDDKGIRVNGQYAWQWENLHQAIDKEGQK